MGHLTTAVLLLVCITYVQFCDLVLINISVYQHTDAGIPIGQNKLQVL